MVSYKVLLAAHARKDLRQVAFVQERAMNIPEEARKQVGQLMRIFLVGEKDKEDAEKKAERFAEFDYALSCVKQQEVPWLAVASISANAFALRAWANDDRGGPGLQDELVGHVLEPLEALHESLEAKGPAGDAVAGESQIEDESHRLLFHVRLALGFVLLAKGGVAEAKPIVHEMAATKNFEHRADIGFGKCLAATTFARIYEALTDYEEALYLWEHGALTTTKETPHSESCRLLDLWREHCQQTSDSRDWFRLLDAAERLLASGERNEAPTKAPSECEKHTAPFLAWKLGQLVAHAALHNIGICEEISGSPIVASLLCECTDARSWQRLRDYYLAIWPRTDEFFGPDILDWEFPGPDTDVYWAMRIGVADVMLNAGGEQTQALVVRSPMKLENLMVEQQELIKEMLTNLAQRHLKHEYESEKRHKELTERLPSPRSKIVGELAERLRTVWREIPSLVATHLIKAERYYWTQVNDDDAKVWFFKAVEGSFAHCFVEPLRDFMGKRNMKQIAMCFPPPRGLVHMNPAQIQRLSLGEWGDIFQVLSEPPGKSLGSLGTLGLMEFIREHYGGEPTGNLTSLASHLRSLQDYRGGSAHFRDADSRYAKEQRELEEMRKLVLGIDGPSVIVAIFQLFRPKS